MNSRNHADDIFDLSLDRSLKNWVNRKNLPSNGRDKLLAAAAQQRMFPSRRKPRKFSFKWKSRPQGHQELISTHLSYAFGFENIDLLITRMAFL